MQLTITDFKKGIKKYLTKATQEDIYLMKYGKVVVKLSGIHDGEAIPAEKHEGAVYVPDVQKDAPARRTRPAKIAKEEIQPAPSAIIDPPAEPKTTEQRQTKRKAAAAITEEAKAVVAKSCNDKSKPTKALSKLKKAETAAPIDPPKSRAVRKPTKPFVPQLEPVKPIESAVPESVHKQRKKPPVAPPVAPVRKAALTKAKPIQAEQPAPQKNTTRAKKTKLETVAKEPISIPVEAVKPRSRPGRKKV